MKNENMAHVLQIRGNFYLFLRLRKILLRPSDTSSRGGYTACIIEHFLSGAHLACPPLEEAGGGVTVFEDLQSIRTSYKLFKKIIF